MSSTSQVSSEESTADKYGVTVTTAANTPFSMQHAELYAPNCSNDTSGDTGLNISCNDLTSTTATTTVSRVSLIDTGSMSKETFKSFERVARYFQYIFVCLGIVTNVCNIVIFTQRRMRNATSTILTFLSGSELGFALSELVVSSSAVYFGRKRYISRIYWTLFRWVRVYMTAVFQRNSFCVNFSVAVERFIAVSFPLKANRILRRKNPVVFCGVLFFVLLVIHIFNPLKLDVVAVDTGHMVIHVLQYSQRTKDQPDVFKSLSLVTKIMFVYIPLFGCLVTNILMVIALKRHSKKRLMLQNSQEGQHHQDRREVQTTVTILMSSFIFVLFSLPVTTTTIIQNIYPEYRTQRREHYLYIFITYVNGLLSLFSLSVDFMVYMIMSRAFRLTFLQLAGSLYSSLCCSPPALHRDSNFSLDGPATTVVSDLESQSVPNYSRNPKDKDTEI